MAEARRPFWRTLYFQVLVAIALGVLVGWLFPDTGRALKPLAMPSLCCHARCTKLEVTPV